MARDGATRATTSTASTAAILMHPRVWEASGHVAGFTDPLVDCKKCKERFRADQLADARCPEKPSKHPGECGGELTEARQFNLMFKTFMGPVEDTASVVYLRPETAQGIFVNFLNVLQLVAPEGARSASRRSARRSATRSRPGNFIFRTREFEQMEMQFFVKPGEDEQWFEYWKRRAHRVVPRAAASAPSKLRFREHGKDELAHYAKGCVDIEYEFPFGWQELEGIANRTDFDLKQHAAVQRQGPQLLRRGDAASASSRT